MARNNYSRWSQVTLPTSGVALALALLCSQILRSGDGGCDSTILYGKFLSGALVAIVFPNNWHQLLLTIGFR